VIDLALVVDPARAPPSRHGNERLVGIVIVKHRPLAGLGTAVGEVEALGDLDCRHPRRLDADRRLLAATLHLRRLETDDVVERALAAWHLAVGQPAVSALEFLEPGHALQHLLARDTLARQRLPMVHAGSFGDTTPS
jgi:hypothetical protein